MNLRDHTPFTIEDFNGLWDRGDIEEVPLDHFSECNNLQYIGSRGFGTRAGIKPTQDVAAPLRNILRFYNYPMSDGNTLLVLIQGGDIYHVVDSTTVLGPILSIATMTDFGFVAYNGRAYITPFTTETQGALNIERGLTSEFLYVYLGDGSNARKAAGSAPTGTLVAANGAAGYTDAGFHIFGVVYETDTGYLTAPGAMVGFVTGAALSVSFSSIPTSPSAAVVARHIVASRVILDFNGDLSGYELFFLATISDNTTTVLANVSFYDQDLIDDATYLFDNYSEIPAGVNLCIYNNRLCLCTTYDNISLILVSAVGEPEAISQIDGLCLVPPNGDPITNIIALRDVLYAFKRNKTYSFVDNGLEPSSWPLSAVDTAMGTGVHGIGTVIDSGSSNVDYLLVGSYNGIILFNGRYILPELSWKIASFWNTQDFKTKNRFIQILNDSVNFHLYVVLTDRSVLHADYSNGFDPKKIKWTPWTFDAYINCLALINVSELILGVDQV